MNKASSLLLPPNVDLLTLQLWPKTSPLCRASSPEQQCLLVRLAHGFAVGESASLSKPETVDLSALCRFVTEGGEPVVVDELNLSANRLLKEVRRLKWKTTSKSDEFSASSSPGGGVLRSLEEADRVTLDPMAIRTFLLVVASTNSSY